MNWFSISKFQTLRYLVLYILRKFIFMRNKKIITCTFLGASMNIPHYHH